MCGCVWGAVYNPLNDEQLFMMWATDSGVEGGQCSRQRGEWVEGNHSDKLYFVGDLQTCFYTESKNLLTDGGIAVDSV